MLGLPMIDDLNEFSKKIAAQVFDKFPQWEGLAGIREDDGEKVLLIKVTPPTGNAECPLSIDTIQDEVTVAFDAYHAHFWDFENSEGDDALSFINLLLSDEYAVVSYWRDDRWCGATLLHESEFPSENTEYPYANAIKIRSWSGSHNNDIQCTPKD